MASEERARSLDMSVERGGLSPAPTYTSTYACERPPYIHFSSPHRNDAPNYPKFHSRPFRHPASFGSLGGRTTWKGKSPERPTKPDFNDPNHPHYIEVATKRPASISPPRTRYPLRHVLIPWTLALVFFLISLWYTSIVFGSRFLLPKFISPSSPGVQEINIIIDGAVLHASTSGTVATISATPKLTMTRTTTSSFSATSVRPTGTGEPVADQQPGLDPQETAADKRPAITSLSRNRQTGPSGFLTAIRMR